MTHRNHPERCPICDAGDLEPRQDFVYRFRYLKQDHEVGGLEHGVCTHCGASLFLAGQMARNKRKIEARQRELTGPMGPQDIIALREKYMISQAQATRIFQCGPRNFSKWERGEVAPTGATALLLRLALDKPDVMRTLAAQAGETVDIPEVKRPAMLVLPKDFVVALQSRHQQEIREAYEAGRREGATVQRYSVAFSSRVDESFENMSVQHDPAFPVSVGVICQEKQKRLMSRRG